MLLNVCLHSPEQTIGYEFIYYDIGTYLKFEIDCKIK